jgi:monolysocardiolipin acyltransferase
MGLFGGLARVFLYGASFTETHGLDRFLELLDKRQEPEKRERGLLTGIFQRT